MCSRASSSSVKRVELMDYSFSFVKCRTVFQSKWLLLCIVREHVNLNTVIFSKFTWLFFHAWRRHLSSQEERMPSLCLWKKKCFQWSCWEPSCIKSKAFHEIRWHQFSFYHNILIYFIMIYAVDHFWPRIKGEKKSLWVKTWSWTCGLENGLAILGQLHLEKVGNFQCRMKTQVCQDTVYPFGSSISRSSMWTLENPSHLNSLELLRGKKNPDLR